MSCTDDAKKCGGGGVIEVEIPLHVEKEAGGRTWMYETVHIKYKPHVRVRPVRLVRSQPGTRHLISAIHRATKAFREQPRGE